MDASATRQLKILAWAGAGLALAIWWVNDVRDDARDEGHAEGRAEGEAWSFYYRTCVTNNQQGWEEHYGRPADTMSDAEAAGISYVCGNHADEQVD